MDGWMDGPATQKKMKKGDPYLKWAAQPSHLHGFPRRIVMSSVGALAKLFTSFLTSSTHVHNKETLFNLVTSRPPATSLLTVSNHMSTLDDPLMWGFRGFPICDSKLSRWILTAEDICFTNRIYSYFFRLGKCIPIRRGAGIYQAQMNEALDRINEGEWLHTFPEGKVHQGPEPLQRLKWGVGSLIARANVPTIVLPIAHSGFEKVMPENYMFGRRPLLPLCWKKISIIVGEPMQFDVAGLKQIAKSISVGSKFSQQPLNVSNAGTHALNHCHAASFRGFSKIVGMSNLSDNKEAIVLGEPQWKWVYHHITEQIQSVLRDLSLKARALNSTSSC